MSNFVLVPGTWMGAWVWEPVTDGLRGEPCWSFRKLEAGHWPMVSVPQDLVESLVEAAESG